jgi:hypothetical protein
MEPRPTIDEIEAILNSDSGDSLDIRPDGSVTITAPYITTTVGAVADEIQHVVRQHMAESTLAAFRREQALASELGQCADELAFWKYQAIYGRAVMLNASVINEELPEDHAAWREAEAQLEDSRKKENDERALAKIHPRLMSSGNKE